MRIRLQLSVAVAFAVLTILVLGVAVSLFYGSNRTLAIETARGSMRDAQAKTDAALVNMFAPVVRTVETMATFLRAFPQDSASINGLAVVDRQINGLPQIESAYFSFAENGALYQVRDTDGPTGDGEAADTELPDKTRIVYRIIEPSDDGMIERRLYLSEGRTLLGEMQASIGYDPRTRPWYELALERDDIAVSPVYIFDSTGQPGVTFSKRAETDTGRLIGVVGADMSLDAFTKELNSIRIGADGEVFILDRQAHLIARSDYAGADQPGAGTGARTDNPVVSAAIEHWNLSGETFFRFRLPGEEEAYLVSVARLSTIADIEPLVGIVVPERQFIGTIIATTRHVLQVSALLMLAAIAGTVLLARLLSRPLRQVADEARRISDFDLSGDFRLSSRITEVNDLGEAVTSMRTSLQSFGAYVPKDLVRSIVSSGETVRVGGTSRELTILFTDIEGFTAKTENLPTEVVMGDLSRYFEAMDKAIFGNGGTIDKYIGDAVMALWNAPEPDPDHVVHACRAALACRIAEAELNARVGTEDLFPTRTRMGLHTDTVLVGNVGSERRLQYTAIGGAVNLASRIEALNKIYGTDILVTQNVVDRAGSSFVFRPVDRVSPAGTTTPIALFELVCEAPLSGDTDDSVTLAREIDAWAAFYALYRARDWAPALQALEALAPYSTRVRLVELYGDRCRAFIRTPPAADWDGVHIYDKK